MDHFQSWKIALKSGNKKGTPDRVFLLNETNFTVCWREPFRGLRGVLQGEPPDGEPDGPDELRDGEPDGAQGDERRPVCGAQGDERRPVCGAQDGERRLPGAEPVCEQRLPEPGDDLQRCSRKVLRHTKSSRDISKDCCCVS